MKNIKAYHASILLILMLLISCVSTRKNSKAQESISLTYALKRIDHLSNQKFPENVRSLLEKLKGEVPNYVKGRSNQVSEIALKLVKIIPEQDFVKMFSSKDEYLFNGKWQGDKVMQNSSNLNKRNLKTLGGNSLNLVQQDKPDLKPDCNCNWTCGGNAGTYHKECLITVAGCGFLLLQPCTGID